MKIIKYIVFFPFLLIKLFVKGFRELSLLLARGFYFYFVKFFSFLKKITNLSFLDSVIRYFQRRREDPIHIVLIIVWFLNFLYLFDYFHVDTKQLVMSPSGSNFDLDSEVVESKENDNDNLLLSKELNLYRIYGKYGIQDIHFDELRKANSDVVAWIIVEGTNINYPVVQTSDNDYYLTHSFDKSYSFGGWVFMDYRNDTDMSNSNTIIYGHNLLNKTAFGSISSIFNSKSENIHIKIITTEHVYLYKVFSVYYIDPEVYYLQNDFFNDDEYGNFLNTIRQRNIISVDNSVSTDDKIITLSTCTDDNKGRKVVHAKLIEVQ